jgi:hypothetical protein
MAVKGWLLWLRRAYNRAFRRNAPSNRALRKNPPSRYDQAGLPAVIVSRDEIDPPGLGPGWFWGM